MRKNYLNKLDLNYRYNFLRNLSFVAGPSFNVYVTGEKVNAGENINSYGTINVPYTVYEHEYASKKLFSWIGFNVGISVKLQGSRRQGARARAWSIGRSSLVKILYI